MKQTFLRMSKLGVLSVLLLVLASGGAVAADNLDNALPRTADGKPDLTGTYNIATLTPLQRPKIFGNKLFLSQEEAEKIQAEEEDRVAQEAVNSDPDRKAPPKGGDGSPGAAGNVGGYNNFWIDRGDDAFAINGQFRTSIIYEPKHGRQPMMTPAGIKKTMAFASLFRENKGEAWWIKTGGVGPYDDPELRPLGERCLLGFGSTAGPPMLPVLYNNLKRIVQTPDHVVILVEMIHDARIIRMSSEHLPDDVRFWMGDSIGRWEGDTLVVDTTNFKKRPALYSASENLHVVERFTRADKDTLLYSFTVDDPTVWTKPWSGEYPWPASEDRVFEYACHEGNYALGNIMRGARLLETETSNGSAGE